MEMNNEQKASILERSLQHLMGEMIDLSRISEMSERAQKQFERTTKIRVNGLIRLLKQEILGISTDNKTQEDKPE